MKDVYLNRVLIYLQQELPDYREQFNLAGDKIVVHLLANVQFQPTDEILQKNIIECIGRIRNREADLDFIIKSKTQERILGSQNNDLNDEHCNRILFQSPCSCYSTFAEGSGWTKLIPFYSGTLKI